jgi:hypothetical protein
MLLLQQLLRSAATCMRACVAACVIDTVYHIYTSAQTQAWRIGVPSSA